MKRQHDAGCYSLRRPKPAYQVAQTGFGYCRLYAEKQCQSGREVEASWQGSKYRSSGIDVTQPVISLLPGDQWVLSQNKENILVASWMCRF